MIHSRGSRILLSLWLWLPSQTGCAGPQLSPVGESRPATGPVEAAPNEAVDLAYTFRLIQGRPPRVEISLRFSGSPSGRTKLRVAEKWANVLRPDKHIGSLSAQGPDGRALELSREQNHIWIVEHEPDAQLTVRWELSGPGKTLDHDPENFHRPIVEADRFHMIGNVGLLFPEHLATRSRPDEMTSGPEHLSGQRVFSVTWEGFREAGMRVACSHSVAQDSFVTSRTIDEFRHAVFLAGDLRLYTEKMAGGVLAVATSGRWGFADRNFVDLARRIVEAERSFFNDHDYPFYLVSLIQVGQEVPGRTATAGTGLTDSIALFISPGLSLAPGSKARQNVAHLLAHELFHNWNGRKIQRQEPERLTYWFSEGFTEYYTRRLLYRSGIISLEDFVEGTNLASVGYHTHPERDASNRRISESFWQGRALRELPYLRGDILALALDHRIRKSSGGKTSLDDFMRALYRHALKTGQRINTAILLDWIKRYTDADFAASLGRVINDGAVLPLPPDLMAPCLKLESRQIGQYQLGFELEASMAGRRVQGVKKGTAAYRAGLRDGQELRGWTINPGRPDKKVELSVREGEKRIPISYYPQKDPRPVPWFTIANPQDCPETVAPRSE